MLGSCAHLLPWSSHEPIRAPNAQNTQAAPLSIWPPVYGHAILETVRNVIFQNLFDASWVRNWVRSRDQLLRALQMILIYIEIWVPCHGGRLGGSMTGSSLCLSCWVCLRQKMSGKKRGQEDELLPWVNRTYGMFLNIPFSLGTWHRKMQHCSTSNPLFTKESEDAILEDWNEYLGGKCHIRERLGLRQKGKSLCQLIEIRILDLPHCGCLAHLVAHSGGHNTFQRLCYVGWGRKLWFTLFLEQSETAVRYNVSSFYILQWLRKKQDKVFLPGLFSV